MAFGGLIAQVPIPSNINVVDFVYAFLFLVPGYVSYKIARQYCANENTHSEFEKIAWSLLGSGVSISIFLVVFSVLTSLAGAESTPDPSTAGVGILAASYLAILLIAAAVGRVGAYGYDNVLQRDMNVVKGNSWSRFSEMIHRRSLMEDAPVSVRVVTERGSVLQGYSKVRGTTQQDMLLMVPKFDGVDEQTFSHYRYTYLPESQIRRVETDEDLLSLKPRPQFSDEELVRVVDGHPRATAEHVASVLRTSVEDIESRLEDLVDERKLESVTQYTMTTTSGQSSETPSAES